VGEPSRNAKEVTQRIVDPYGLVYFQGTWMLIGFCHLRKDIRMFALDRVMKVKERGLLFKPVEGFDLEEFLAQGWGIYHGKEVRVTVKFFSEVADYILRKDKWHPSEKREVLPDGTVLLSFRVMGLDELKGWIYSWIPFVEVVKPKWLRKQVSEELGNTARRHG
jgi:predicted DNA-binding transcriptional regulator YafY